MRDSYTIVVDSREQVNKLIFPATICTLDPGKSLSKKAYRRVTLTTVEEAIPKGDYLLQGFEDACIVEAKAGINEIAANCLNRLRRIRLISELDHLARCCRYPVLLLRGKPTSLLSPTKLAPQPGTAISTLFRLCLERRIWMLVMEFDTLSQRQAVGEMVAHLLITASHTHPLKC